MASFLVLALVMVGCGDDEDGERPRYRSDVSVSTDTSVSDLGDEDLRRICASLDAHVTAHIDLDLVAYLACLPGAILTRDRNQCEAELDQCMAAFPEPIAIHARFRDPALCVSSLRGCGAATVADLDGCVNLNLGIVYDLLDRLSCGGVSDAEAQRAARDATAINVCADVNAACNDFANVRPE